MDAPLVVDKNTLYPNASLKHAYEKNKLFTVVIPNLNQGQFIEHALVSLFSQAGEKDYEVIIVDGGSTDSSIGIIKKYENRLAWWCSERDSGQSEALNKGFIQAKGRFLTWLNADDVMLPGTLERVRKCVQMFDERGEEINWIAGNMIHMDAQEQILWCARGENWHNFLFRHAPVRVYGPSSFFLKSLFEKTTGFDLSFRVAMDKDLWLMFKNLGATYVRVNAYFWGFRVHDNSKTRGAEYDRIPEHKEENARVNRKNGLVVTSSGIMLQRLWRLLNGSYVLSAWDTLRFKGKRITDINILFFT